MDIDTAATPAGGEDTHVSASETVNPEASTPAEGTAPEANASDIDLTDLVPAEPLEDEFEEIERGEKKYKVPKDLKGEFLMHQDYTKKTMELAEQRKATEARAAALEQAEKLSTEERRSFAKVDQLTDTIEAYEKVDWRALEQADPTAANSHWREFQMAKDERAKLASGLQRQITERQTREQQETAKRREERDATVSKEIPNWATRKGELEQFATRYGYTPEGLAENAAANDYKLLHFAEIGARFIERQKAAAKAAGQAGIKPAPEVGGTASAGIDPKSLSMEAYIAARKADQI
jgi:hypothetical protein